jgi:hypothetical protein
VKCFYDGAELFPNYKGRRDSWKCPVCKRWFVGKETDWKWKETELAREVSKQKVGKISEERRTEHVWEEKVAGKINFDKVGMEVLGRITDITQVQMPNAKVNSYTMVLDSGETVSFLGTTVLDRLVGHELNSLVKIKYLGLVKTGGARNLKTFQVHIWRDDAIVPDEAEVPVEEEDVPITPKKKR